ncbi:hypothetical protein N9A72_00560 [bacterium]|nr:hypothetical protein [bacterium]
MLRDGKDDDVVKLYKTEKDKQKREGIIAIILSCKRANPESIIRKTAESVRDKLKKVEPRIEEWWDSIPDFKPPGIKPSGIKVLGLSTQELDWRDLVRLENSYKRIIKRQPELKDILEIEINRGKAEKGELAWLEDKTIYVRPEILSSKLLLEMELEIEEVTHLLYDLHPNPPPLSLQEIEVNFIKMQHFHNSSPNKQAHALSILFQPGIDIYNFWEVLIQTYLDERKFGKLIEILKEDYDLSAEKIETLESLREEKLNPSIAILQYVEKEGVHPTDVEIFSRKTLASIGKTQNIILELKTPRGVIWEKYKDKYGIREKEARKFLDGRDPLSPEVDIQDFVRMLLSLSKYENGNPLNIINMREYEQIGNQLSRIRSEDLVDFLTPERIGNLKSSKKFVVYCGPSGAGKGIIFRMLMNKYPDIFKKFLLYNDRRMIDVPRRRNKIAKDSPLYKPLEDYIDAPDEKKPSIRELKEKYGLSPEDAEKLDIYIHPENDPELWLPREVTQKERLEKAEGVIYVYTEFDDIDYRFVTTEYFEALSKELDFETYRVHGGKGDMQGLDIAEMIEAMEKGEKITLLECEIGWTDRIKKASTRVPYKIFINPVTEEDILTGSAKGRNLNEVRRDVLFSRLMAREKIVAIEKAEKEFKNRIDTAIGYEFPRIGEFDYVVVNREGEREKAIEDFVSSIFKEIFTEILKSDRALYTGGNIATIFLRKGLKPKLEEEILKRLEEDFIVTKGKERIAEISPAEKRFGKGLLGKIKMSLMAIILLLSGIGVTALLLSSGVTALVMSYFGINPPVILNTFASFSIDSVKNLLAGINPSVILSTSADVILSEAKNLLFEIKSLVGIKTLVFYSFIIIGGLGLLIGEIYRRLRIAPRDRGSPIDDVPISQDLIEMFGGILEENERGPPKEKPVVPLPTKKSIFNPPANPNFLKQIQTFSAIQTFSVILSKAKNLLFGIKTLVLGLGTLGVTALVMSYFGINPPVILNTFASFSIDSVKNLEILRSFVPQNDIFAGIKSALIVISMISIGAGLTIFGKTIRKKTEILIQKLNKLSRIKDGIVAGVGSPDVHGRIFTPDSPFFTPEGEFTDDLKEFMDNLSDESVREGIHAGIMYYDIRSKFWKENPAFTVAFALAFARKLQKKTGKEDGIILHIGVDAYDKHFKAAQIFADTILRTGICDNGGGIYYWGIINGGDSRNYGQLYEAVNGEGGHWVYFTMSHRPEDFLGTKMGINAQVYCGSEVRHCEGVTSGTLYDAIVEKDFPDIKHKAPIGDIINIESFLENNIQVAADMIRATSAGKDIPTNELLKGAKLYVDMGGNPIGKNLVDMLIALGADVEVGNEELEPNFNTGNIIDPNEHSSPAIQRLREKAEETGRVVLAVDPDGDRGSIVAVGKDGKAISMTGSELLLLTIENLAQSYKAREKTPTIISDMRTGLSARDLAEKLNEMNIPVEVSPREAGYPFFMRGMALLPADVAVENTTHAFANPMTNKNWGAKENYSRPDGKGYQGGDNAALYLIYLLGCMVHQWKGRNPARQLKWIRETYKLRSTVVDEKKPALSPEHDSFKYMIAERMKELAVKWFKDNLQFSINVELLSGVHITNTETSAMMLVRFSNTGASFTISGEGYTKEELNQMLGLGHLLLTTAVKQLREEGNEFGFDEKDSADLRGVFDKEKIGDTKINPQTTRTEVLAREDNLSISMNISEKAIGKEDGLTEEQLKSVDSRLKEIWAKLKKEAEDYKTLVEKGIAWMKSHERYSEIEKVKKVARSIMEDYKEDKVKDFVILGIGGSDLGARALHEALNSGKYYNSRKDRKGPGIHFIGDNSSPEEIDGLLNSIDLKTTIFNVVSKSGTTPETIANYRIFMKELIKAVGEEDWRKHIIYHIFRVYLFFTLQPPPFIN